MATPGTPPVPAEPRWLPWRSAALGWAVVALALVGGVPLFLCMPPWNDVTLHDMAVRSMLRGGVHYRDVFDTNLPGIDWSMAGVRRLFGWSYEALRAVDLVVIAAELVLLLGWVRRAGGTGYSVAWLAAAAALFYPFTSEFNHVQRDPWLLLPALVATRLRLVRVSEPNPPTPFPEREGGESPLPRRGRGLGEGFWYSVLEGVAWGAAVWVKPHVLVPAFAVWAVSAVLIARREGGRGVWLDLGGLVLGGLLAGAAGVAWLVGTGAWPHFLDVFLNWNPGYLADVLPATGHRLAYTTWCFRPWSLLHVAALPLAVLALLEARAWSRRPGGPRRVWGEPWLYAPAETESTASARALLAAFYLGWFAESVFLQKGFEYVQVPLLLLAMAVVATHRWVFGFVYLLWFAVVTLVWNVPALAKPAWELDRELGKQQFQAIRLERHPLTNPAVVGLWPRCWCEGGSPELRDKLGQYTDVFCGTNWEELDDVARFLKTVDPPLGPGELNCWHDSTHPLYLMLDLDPATRYMHYGTAFGIRKQAGRIAGEVAASRQRYVVSDLMRMTWYRGEAYAPGAGGDPLKLPAWFPVSQRDKFPWNQPIRFRSGRYLVHEVVNPLGVIDIPDWATLDSLGPGE
jgi:hypothetical protein